MIVWANFFSTFIIICIYGFHISWDGSVCAGGFLEEMLKEQLLSPISRAPPNCYVYYVKKFICWIPTIQRLRIFTGKIQWEGSLKGWHPII